MPNHSKLKNLTFIHSNNDVHMGDDWYDIATEKHFWMRRRWKVLTKLLSKKVHIDLNKIADIGCGIGTQSNIIKKFFRAEVDGIDLNSNALTRAAETFSECNFLCMNVLNPPDKFLFNYDAVFILDILEHLENPAPLLSSCAAILKDQGIAIINVPSGPSLFSSYDEVVGHQRRYSLDLMLEQVNESGLKILSWSFWGASLIPLLLARKMLLRKPNSKTIRNGFSVSNYFFNEILYFLSNIEYLPNHIFGSSLMVIAQKK